MCADRADDEDGVVAVVFKPSKNYSYRMTKQQIFKMKQVFDVFDDDYDGVIDLKYLGTAMRAVGVLISNDDLEATIKELAGEGLTSTIEMSRFFILVATKLRDAGDAEKKTKAAWKGIYTDPNDPLMKRIPLKALRTKLSSSGGEPIEDDMLDLFMRKAVKPEYLSPDGSSAEFDPLVEWIMADLEEPVDLTSEDDESKEEEEKKEGKEGESKAEEKKE